MQGPLSERLKLIAAHFCERLVEYSRAVDRLVARLHANDAVVGVPEVGEMFPDFILPDSKGYLWWLATALEEGQSFLPSTVAIGAIIAT